MALKNVLGLVLTFFLAGWTQAQSAPASNPVDCPASGTRCGYDGGCLSTVVFLEQCKHVPLTPAALTAALQASDPVIRSLAADVLATHTEITGMSTDEAAKILVAAFKKEKQIKFEIAVDLLALGVPDGIAALRQLCDDNHTLTAQRIGAGMALARTGDDWCLPTALAIAASGDDGERASALSALPEYRHSSPQQIRTIFDTLVRALGDKTSLVRYTAGLALVEIGNPDAIPFLEKAIAAEQDRDTKAQLETDLHRLQGRAP